MRASISTTGREQITGLTVHVAYLLKIDFTAGAILCCTGNRKITYDGDEYSPNGLWKGVRGIEERAGRPPAASIIMAKAGDMETRIQAGGYRRTSVEIFQAIMDEDWTLIDAFPMGSYRIGNVSMQLSQDSYTYTVACSSDLEDGYRAHPVYPSGTMQQLRYPGDTYMKGASAITGYEFEWGGWSLRVTDSNGCVAVDEWIDGKRAGDIKTGDVMRVADPDTLKEAQAEVLYSGLSLQPGVKITTDTGRTLRCSTTAPIATDSGLVRAKHLLNYSVVIEGGTYERVVSVEPLGDIAVQHIYLGEQCFWVNGFLHHNKTRKTPLQKESIDSGFRALPWHFNAWGF